MDKNNLKLWLEIENDKLPFPKGGTQKSKGIARLPESVIRELYDNWGLAYVSAEELANAPKISEQLIILFTDDEE